MRQTNRGLASIQERYFSLFRETPNQKDNKDKKTTYQIIQLLTSSPKGNDRSPENKQVFLNSSLVSERFFSICQGQPTLQSMVDQILNSIKLLLCCKFATKKNDALKSQRRSCQ